METNNYTHKGKAIMQGTSVKHAGFCMSNGFPAGLRVLLVDDDRTCLIILEKMLQNCLYKVTKCRHAKEALSMLRADKNKFDIVVIDLHMPDMDGFKLLEIAEFEMNLPVVMMSSDDDHEVVKKGVLHGACDYLIKPIRMEALRMIWQHVIRRKKNVASLEDDKLILTKPDNDEHRVPGNTKTSKSLKKRKTDEDGDDDDEASDPSGKKRMIWTNELHEKFVIAFNHLGSKNAVPLKILECLQTMNVHGITREHIASHLQKYRINLRKQDDIPQVKPEQMMYSRFNKRSIFEQPRSLDNQFSANPHQFPLPLASMPAPLNVIPNTGLSFDDQRRLVHSGIQESSYKSLTKSSGNDFPFISTFGAGPSKSVNLAAGIPSLGQEHECMNKENVAQNSQSLDSFDDLYDLKGDAMPQLIYEPTLYLQHFDQNEIFQGPFIQQGAEPLLIKYNSATQFDKCDF